MLQKVIEEKDPGMELRCLCNLGQVRQEHEIVRHMHCTCGVVGRCQWEAQGEVHMSHSHKLWRTFRLAFRLGRLWTLKFKMHCMSANMMALGHWWAILAVVSGMSQILPHKHQDCLKHSDFQAFKLWANLILSTGLCMTGASVKREIKVLHQCDTFRVYAEEYWTHQR